MASLTRERLNKSPFDGESAQLRGRVMKNQEPGIICLAEKFPVSFDHCFPSQFQRL
jgi:hypothetical protein